MTPRPEPHQLALILSGQTPKAAPFMEKAEIDLEHQLGHRVQLIPVSNERIEAGDPLDGHWQEVVVACNNQMYLVTFHMRTIPGITHSWEICIQKGRSYVTVLHSNDRRTSRYPHQTRTRRTQEGHQLSPQQISPSQLALVLGQGHQRLEDTEPLEAKLQQVAQSRVRIIALEAVHTLKLPQIETTEYRQDVGICVGEQIISGQAMEPPVPERTLTTTRQQQGPA